MYDKYDEFYDGGAEVFPEVFIPVPWKEEGKHECCDGNGCAYCDNLRLCVDRCKL